MANWCSNQIHLSGKPERVQKLLSYLTEQLSDNKEGIIHIGDYLFELEIEGDTLFFGTKWTGSESFAGFIETFGVHFNYYAEESGCGYYMQYKYNPDINARSVKYLEQDDAEFDEENEDAENNSWDLMYDIKDV
jgi:hypothetical protein